MLADGEPLLRSQNHAGMVSPNADPLGMESIEIADIEGVEYTSLRRGEGELRLIPPSDQIGV